eukprot:GHUV01029982.1.p1 GENE.GHUV01029982.1~~GHUV01029982.1.p1  ORF type:complete len:154 (+),score=15.40 GHUV01029982.1:149-610(+)
MGWCSIPQPILHHHVLWSTTPNVLQSDDHRRPSQHHTNDKTKALDCKTQSSLKRPRPLNPYLPDLGHLFAHTTNIIIANFIQLLLIFTFDGLTLTEDLSVWSYNTVLCGGEQETMSLSQMSSVAALHRMATPHRLCWELQCTALAVTPLPRPN